MVCNASVRPRVDEISANDDQQATPPLTLSLSLFLRSSRVVDFMRTPDCHATCPCAKASRRARSAVAYGESPAGLPESNRTTPTILNMCASQRCEEGVALHGGVHVIVITMAGWIGCYTQ